MVGTNSFTAERDSFRFLALVGASSRLDPRCGVTLPDSSLEVLPTAGAKVRAPSLRIQGEFVIKSM